MEIKVKFPSGRNKRRELEAQLDAIGLTFRGAEQRILGAASVAEEMLGAGFDLIDEVNGEGESVRIASYTANPVLVEWFGKVDKIKHIQTIHNRLNGICRRFASGFTVSVRPDRGQDQSAMTWGAGNLFGDRFRIFTKGVRQDIIPLAELIIHELGHNWFGDQKIEKVEVYTGEAAKALAQYNPRKARRSPKNYELYCSKVHAEKGLRRDEASPNSPVQSAADLRRFSDIP